MAKPTRHFSHLLALLLLLSSPIARCQCPTTTEGVDPRLLSACSQLQAELSSQLATGNSAGATLTLTFIPTSGGPPPTSDTSIPVANPIPVQTSSSANRSRTRPSSQSTITSGSRSAPVVEGSSTALTTTSSRATLVLSSNAISPTTTASSSSSLSSSTTATVGGVDGSQEGTSTSNNGGGLSGGAIAGIVVGAVIGAALILGLCLFFCFFLRRRRRRSDASSIDASATALARSSPDDEKATMSGYHENGRAAFAAPVAPVLAATSPRMSPRETASPTSPLRTSDDSMSAPWAVQPLRHFRRAYGEEPRRAEPEPTLPVVAPHETDDFAHPRSGEGLTALAEASDEDSDQSSTPRGQQNGFSRGAAGAAAAPAASTAVNDPRSGLRTFFSTDSGGVAPGQPGFVSPAGTNNSGGTWFESPRNSDLHSGVRPDSSGVWSGLSQESDSWWNSGVPSDEGSVLGTTEGATGAGRIIEGPWNGNLAPAEIGLQEPARPSGSAGSNTRSLRRSVRRLSIPRKPLPTDDVGVAR